MSEEPKKSLVETESEKVDNFLDNYEQNIGLKNLVSTDVSKYLNMTHDTLRKLSPDECVEAAYLLNQEALYVQHQINKYLAQIKWANNKIDRVIGETIAGYGTRYTPWDSKKLLAIKNNTYTQELYNLVVKAELIVARISYVPNHLKNLSNVLLDYKYNKVNTIREQNNESTRIN